MNYRATIGKRTFESDTLAGFEKLLQKFCDAEHKPGVECRVCGTNEYGWVRTGLTPTATANAIVETVGRMVDVAKTRLYRPAFIKIRMSSEFDQHLESLAPYREVGEGAPSGQTVSLLLGIPVEFMAWGGYRGVELQYRPDDEGLCRTTPFIVWEWIP